MHSRMRSSSISSGSSDEEEYDKYAIRSERFSKSSFHSTSISTKSNQSGSNTKRLIFIDPQESNDDDTSQETDPYRV